MGRWASVCAIAIGAIGVILAATLFINAWFAFALATLSSLCILWGIKQLQRRELSGRRSRALGVIGVILMLIGSIVYLHGKEQYSSADRAYSAAEEVMIDRSPEKRPSPNEAWNRFQALSSADKRRSATLLQLVLGSGLYVLGVWMVFIAMRRPREASTS